LKQRKGVLQENLKTFVDLGASLVATVAAIFVQQEDAHAVDGGPA
jgi:hypothetical protein